MATKKITELQLISAITGSENLPADNGLQTYRCTPAQLKSYILANQNILLAMLKDDIFNGLTSVTAADDDYFPLIDTSDSNKTKKALVGSFVRTKYRAVSSYPATVTSSDGTLKLSGSSGTITLPAAGNPGIRYKFIHAGTSLTQVYTLATTGGSTIGGIASGSYALYTNGEVLEVEGDGTDWIIVHHRAVTGIIDGGAITFGATTTAPTKPTGIGQDRVYWWRDGMFMCGRYEWRQTNTTSAASGTGDYLFQIPGSQSIDTTRGNLTTYSTAEGSGGFSTRSRVGNLSVGNTITNGEGCLSVYDATNLRGFVIAMETGASQSYAIGAGAFGLATSANNFIMGDFRVPIVGWQP